MGSVVSFAPVNIERMLSAARVQAEADGAVICIAIVDQAGSLAGFLRMTGAYFISTDLAMDKAWTAAGMRMSTAQLGAVLASEPDAVRHGLLRRPRLTEVPGGVAIMVDGLVHGAVGVSGGTAEQDVRAATVAMDYYLEGLS